LAAAIATASTVLPTRGAASLAVLRSVVQPVRDGRASPAGVAAAEPPQAADFRATVRLLVVRPETKDCCNVAHDVEGIQPKEAPEGDGAQPEEGVAVPAGHITLVQHIEPFRRLMA